MTPQRSSSTTAQETARKWVPKTAAQVVLEQITRQEKRVATMRDELALEERELAKLQQARKVLEAS